MATTEIVKFEPKNTPVPAWEVFSNAQLLALYGKVLRVYAKNSNVMDWDPDSDEYTLARRMRQEIVRRVGDYWLTKWHQS